MRKKLIGTTVIVFLVFNAYTEQTRLMIGDDGKTLIEKVFEVELAAGVGEASLPIKSLPMQVLSESVVLRDTSAPPRVKVVSQVFHQTYSGPPPIMRPIWVLDVPEPGIYVLKLSYLINNMKWTGAYNFFVDADVNVMTLEGVVSIQNYSDESYRNAEIVLAQHSGLQPFVDVTSESIHMQMISHAGFLDKDLISLGTIDIIEAAATTNLSLFDMARVDIQPFLQYTETERNYYAYTPMPETNTPSVWWRLEMAEAPENRLGIPLPKGTVHVYQDMADGAVLRFNGNIETIFPGQPLRLNLIPEPGIIVSRQIELLEDGPTARSSPLFFHRISLTNTLEHAHEVRVFTRPPSQILRKGVAISDASDAYTTHDNGFIEFRVEVIPGAEKEISFKVAM